MAQTKEGAQITAAKIAGISVQEFRERIAAGLKKCTKCKLWSTATTFQRDRSRGDGLSSIGRCCRIVKVRVNRKGRPSCFKGRKHTAAAKALMSAALKGRPGPRKGQKLSLAERQRISAATIPNTPRGERHHAWKNGAKQRNFDGRRKPEYKWWRESVFTRDNFTCQKCGDARGGNLRAHHIKPFADFPELRYDVSNGVTYCHPCHELEHFKPDSIRNVRKLKRGEHIWK